MEGQNRYFFKLLLGEHTDLGKRGLKLKLSSARSYWGSSEVSNFDMCPVGKLFRTQKMMKIKKNGNIALLNLFCQRAAIGVENRVEDHRRQNSLPEMPRKPRYKSLNSVTKRQRKYKVQRLYKKCQSNDLQEGLRALSGFLWIFNSGGSEQRQPGR